MRAEGFLTGLAVAFLALLVASRPKPVKQIPHPDEAIDGSVRFDADWWNGQVA